MSEKEDLRVIKTRRNIEEAFLDLLGEHSFDRITVRQLLDKALISKGTFYAHYLDKYDLAEKIANDALGEFRAGIHARMEAARTGNDHAAIMASLAHTLKNTIPRLCRLQSVHTEKIDIERDMRAIITEEYFTFQRGRGAKLECPELRAQIVTTFILGFLAWQQAHPFENTLAEYVHEIYLMVSEYETAIAAMMKQPKGETRCGT